MGTFKKKITGWGKIAEAECFLRRPERIDVIEFDGICAARGLGRSYGDAALNSDHTVFLMERLNRLLDFDQKTGLLRAESGVTLRDIIKTFVPRGFFVPVTPGTKEVTLGGCLAADVHGKNHHVDGSFSDHVDEFEIVLPSGVKRVQKGDLLFQATAGGMGLTGIIREMTLKLLPIETPFIKARHTPFTSIDNLLQYLKEDKERYSVAWLDLLSSQVNSIAISGDHLKKSELTRSLKPDIAPNPIQIPFRFPAWALNNMTQRLFNTLYFQRQKLRREPFISTLEAFFYPLDKIGNWNRIYGKRGFYQYQFVVPEKGFLRVFEKVKKLPIYLAVLKKFGKESSGFLSFPKEGFTLACDIPGDVPDLFHLLEKLDEMVLEEGGRVYLAKDLHLNGTHFRGMYPRLKSFEEVKKSVDPKKLIQTDLSRRLQL